jgi:hemerythrin-like domain-containing protein
MPRRHQAIVGNQDVVDFLTDQHEEIKRLFVETLDAADAAAQEKSFNRLRTLLAVHETAEEMMVHPRVRRKITDGPAIVAARLAEEHDSKVALEAIEKLEFGTAEFSKSLIHLQAAVLSHAEKEETEEFTRLEEELDAEELKKLTAAVLVAERIAPTRAHAGVESAAANFFVGPFASVLDRARDALKRVTN